jgi:hypothetical protein
MSTPSSLAHLPQLANAVRTSKSNTEAARAQLEAAVRLARSDGASWRALATATDLSIAQVRRICGSAPDNEEVSDGSPTP